MKIIFIISPIAHILPIHCLCIALPILPILPIASRPRLSTAAAKKKVDGYDCMQVVLAIVARKRHFNLKEIQ